MTIHPSSFLLLPILLLSLVSVAAAVADSTSDGGLGLVNATCRHTRYYDLCMSSLLSDPRSATADLPTLATISLDLALSHAESTYSYVETLMQQPAYDAYAAGCLGDCLSQYSDAVDNLKKAREALGASSFESVNAEVSGAMSDAEACEEGFQDKDGYVSPLTERNGEFSKLCSNSLAIIVLLCS